MSDLFANAAEIMLVGMVTVIAFLLLLIVVMSAMAKILPKPDPIPKRTAPKPGQRSDSAASEPVIAAISAAIHRYRNTQNKK